MGCMKYQCEVEFVGERSHHFEGALCAPCAVRTRCAVAVLGQPDLTDGDDAITLAAEGGHCRLEVMVGKFIVFRMKSERRVNKTRESAGEREHLPVGSGTYYGHDDCAHARFTSALDCG